MSRREFQPQVLEFSLREHGFQMVDGFHRLSRLPHPIFLDGCRGLIDHGPLNRYSFLAADPIERIIVEPGSAFDFDDLRQTWSQYGSQRLDGLPPFQGGLAGYLAYDLNTCLESIEIVGIDDLPVPIVALFLYDVVVAVDHDLQTGWIISQGWPESGGIRRQRRAAVRLQQFQQLLFDDQRQEDPISTPVPFPSGDRPAGAIHPIQHSLEMYSDFTPNTYRQTVDQAIEYICAGDVFQVNLSQRLVTPATRSSSQLYLDLRRLNPAPFSAYLDFGPGQIISASPERLVNLINGEIETRPIKGTRKRTRHPEVDLNLRQDLMASQKDRAENVMIVDLMRNDLSRVASPDSVIIKKLCGVEEFQNVQHLVSVVTARLQAPHDGIDLLQAVFPGGSITGAPKIRAMEIIAELEPTVRGAYCGSLGYIGFDGNLDFNILIRTVTASDGWWQIPAGGGIVSDSVPELEYAETWTKAAGMLQAVSPSVADHRSQKLAGNW